MFWVVFSSIKSSLRSSSPVTGQVPVTCKCFSIKLFSKTCPDFRETTGCTGGSPEMLQQSIAPAGLYFHRWHDSLAKNVRHPAALTFFFSALNIKSALRQRPKKTHFIFPTNTKQKTIQHFAAYRRKPPGPEARVGFPRFLIGIIPNKIIISFDNSRI